MGEVRRQLKSQIWTPSSYSSLPVRTSRREGKAETREAELRQLETTRDLRNEIET